MIASILVGIIILLALLYVYNHRKKCLPGPWNLPILGYLHKLDPKSPYLTLTELAQKYGPVYTVQFGLIDVVVIADAKLLKKVLSKDEAIGRPPFYLLNVIFGAKGLANSHVELWKDQRKFVTNFLRLVGAAKITSNKATLEGLINNRAVEFLQLVKKEGHRTPLDPSEFIIQYVTGVAGEVLLGKSFLNHKEYRTTFVKNFDYISKLASFGGALHFLPFLRFIQPFKKTVTSIKEAVHEIHEILSKLISECEKSIPNLTVDAASNLTEAFLLEMSKNGLDHIYNYDQLRYLLFDVYAGFSETTITWLQWIFLYLAQYSEVQNKVRKELLGVLNGKMPQMEDFLRLPYTKATIAEASRIRTLTTLGVPHYASEDIYVENYRIGKGTMILPLLWAVHMNPEVWTNPEQFYPERFLNDGGEFCQSEFLIPFSTGKRMCVGEEMGKMMVHLFVATVLQKFKIELPSSASVDFSGIFGIVLTPKPQNLIFTTI